MFKFGRYIWIIMVIQREMCIIYNDSDYNVSSCYEFTQNIKRHVLSLYRTTLHSKYWKYLKILLSYWYFQEKNYYYYYYYAFCLVLLTIYYSLFVFVHTKQNFIFLLKWKTENAYYEMNCKNNTMAITWNISFI